MSGYYECGSGWWSLITETLNSIENMGVKVHVEQVKEKFGGLRLYARLDGPEELVNKGFDLIGQAEAKSFELCEYCGDAGMLMTTDSGWFKTLCPSCVETEFTSRGRNVHPYKPENMP